MKLIYIIYKMYDIYGFYLNFYIFIKIILTLLIDYIRKEKILWIKNLQQDIPITYKITISVLTIPLNNIINKILNYLLFIKMRKIFLKKLKNTKKIDIKSNNKIINAFFTKTKIIANYTCRFINIFPGIFISYQLIYHYKNYAKKNYKLFSSLTLIYIFLNYLIDKYKNESLKINEKIGINFDYILSYFKINGILNQKLYFKKLQRLNNLEKKNKNKIIIIQTLITLMEFITNAFALNTKSINIKPIQDSIKNIFLILLYNNKFYNIFVNLSEIWKLNQLQINNKNLQSIDNSIEDTNSNNVIYYNKKTKLKIIRIKKNINNKKIIIEYKKVSVFNNKNINLKIYKNDLILLNGPSGSGKSNILKSFINNKYIINGIYYKYLKPKEIFYIPSEFDNYFNKYNWKEYCKILSLNIKNNNKLTKEIIKNLNIENLINNILQNKIQFSYLNNLSSGEKRKFLIFIFLLSKNVKMFLVDDMFSSIKLKTININKIKEYIMNKTNKKNISVVITNNLDLQI